MMTHNNEILDWLKSGKSITPWIALREFGCMRLAARIADLRKMGYNIVSETRTYETPEGRKVRYAEYRLAA